MAFQDTYRLSAHAVITNPAGQILQLEATYNGGGWGLPGGSLEPGETIHQALLRECQEELGCRVEILYMSGMYYHRVYSAHACIFRCELETGAEITLSAEHAACRYFDLQDLSSVQQRRVKDCLNFDGIVKSASF